MLGGPLDGEREILHAISASSEADVRERLARDNWARNGMLTITSIEPWTILLDGRAHEPRPGAERASARPLGRSDDVLKV
jgi:hypothetical protein